VRAYAGLDIAHRCAIVCPVKPISLMEMQMRFTCLWITSMIFITLIATACVKPAKPAPPAGLDGTQSVGKDTSGDVSLATGDPQYESRPGDSGNRPTTPSADGSVVTSTTGGLPENWPADIPIMGGFEVKMGMVNPQGWKSATASGTVPADDVMNFYSALKGWQKDPNFPWVTKGPSRILKLIRGKENLSANINERDNRTELTLTYWNS
jgi:hypothetical protein